MKTLFFFFLLMPSFVFAQAPCSRSGTAIKSFLLNPDSRISFKNDGGLMNGGVCWWHARLQRSSAYLVKFAPEKKRPGRLELQNILRSLRVMDRVITIPGYADFFSFTQDYQKEVQSLLNDWQQIDGLLNFEWIRGISGHSQLPSLDMMKRMENVFDYYTHSPVPLWIMAQMKGVTSHALLILTMERTENGYDLEVIDSNYPEKTISLEYHEGDHYLTTAGGTPFVPYVGFQNDFRLIKEALQKSCSREQLYLPDVKDGNVEPTYSTEQQY